MAKQKEKLVQTFLELVQIDSPSGHEDKMRKYVIGKLKKLGIKSSVDKAGNILAKIDGEGELVLLSCHLDTVEPGRGIKPIIKNGVIRSDGTTILGADNKVTIAAILETLSSLKKNHRSIEVVFSVREETDSGISKFDFSGLKSKVGVVADSASPIGTIIIASPYITDLEIEITGKSAHSSIPENGINALTSVVSSLNSVKPGRFGNHSTFNVGLISGGSATNTIPGKVLLEGELRSFSNEEFNAMREKVKDVFRRKAKRYGVKIEYSEKPHSVGYRLNRSSKEVSEVRKAFKKLGLKPKYEKSFGGSDANSFIQHGIKVVNIGDGSKNSHTTKESVTVGNLVKLSEVFFFYVST